MTRRDWALPIGLLLLSAVLFGLAWVLRQIDDVNRSVRGD